MRWSFFADPATGRARCGLLVALEKSAYRIDPVEGGEALVVINVGSEDVTALAAFADPATRVLLRIACGCYKRNVRMFDPVAGGARRCSCSTGHTEAQVMAYSRTRATGELRLASGSYNCSCASGTWPRAAAALFVLEGHTRCGCYWIEAQIRRRARRRSTSPAAMTSPRTVWDAEVDRADVGNTPLSIAKNKGF